METPRSIPVRSHPPADQDPDARADRKTNNYRFHEYLYACTTGDPRGAFRRNLAVAPSVVIDMKMLRRACRLTIGLSGAAVIVGITLATAVSLGAIGRVLILADIR